MTLKAGDKAPDFTLQDETGLRTLAQSSGGQFLRLQNPAQIVPTLTKLGEVINQQAGAK